MRPIKFRAWDKKNKKMFFNVQNIYDTLGYHGPKNESTPDDYDEYRLFESNFSDLLGNSDYEIMQFTGLLDSKGKAIWEGDVIREDFNPNSNIWEIKFMPSYFTAEGKGYRFPLFSLQYHIEVIGNIYEHPELLK